MAEYYPIETLKKNLNMYFCTEMSFEIREIQY